MDELIKILVDRLVGKGMEILTIPAYVRDLANIMVMNRYSNLRELNRRLQLLGWNDFEIDNYTRELVTAIFEPRSEYKPSQWFERAFNSKGIDEQIDEKESQATPQADSSQTREE